MILLLAAALAAAAPAPRDLDAAQVAWRYFVRNTDPMTGLVRSVDGYPSTSAWEMGSSLIAIVAARQLRLIAEAELDERAGALLATLGRLPLYDGGLPNKAYDTARARMTDYANAPAPAGIGWSAVDLGRLVSALVLLGELHPAHRPAVEAALGRWDACRVVRGGELHGGQAEDGGPVRVTQEGRLGYEQYAAQAFELIGLEASAARRWDRHAADVAILGVKVPRDRRDARTYGAVDAVVTEPWVLDAFEFGLEPAAAPLARQVFEVQKRRFERTGAVTALSEDHLDRPPWFVYDAIWADGHAWRTVSPAGAAVAGLRSVSTKAALALSALYPDDPYAAVLREAVEGARDPERGWFAGVYEDGALNRSLNANTNGVVLEAVLYAARGPLHLLGADAPGALAWRARLARLGRAGRSCVAPARLGGAPLDGGSGDGGSGGGGSGGVTPGPGPAGLGPAGLSRVAAPTGRTHAAGTFYLGYRGTDRGGTGLLATVYPHSFWFLRGGAEWTPFSPFGSSRFLWGFGYDDWHDGTFSLTVHNWGPVRPEDGVGMGKTELNVGYKVPKLCSEWLCAQAFPFATVPLEGGPYVGGRVTFALWEKWFVMGGVGYTLPGVFPPPPGIPRWRYFYGFGRRDWRPGSIFISYHDWGPNWQAHNGILSVGVNWQF